MSLYSTKATSKRVGPRPVWHFYFFSVAAIVLALAGYLIYAPREVPPRDELVKTGGDMIRLMIRDDFSNTGAGAMLPMFTSVYMRFRGIDKEFRYPWTFPKFHRVREYTAVYVEIWVEKAALDRDEAPLIWALKEDNYFKEEDRQTIVLYEDVVEGQKKNGVILIKFTLVMAGVSIVFAFLGIGIGRLNRKKYPDFYA